MALNRPPWRLMAALTLLAALVAAAVLAAPQPAAVAWAAEGGDDGGEDDGDSVPRDFWTEMKETFRQIREALSLAALLDSFTMWVLEQHQRFVDLFASSIGAAIVTMPLYARGWVVSGWNKALLWALLPMAPALIYLAWRFITARPGPAGDGSGGIAAATSRAVGLFLALVFAVLSLYAMDLAIAVQNDVWREAFQEAGAIADVEEGAGCDILGPDAGRDDWGASIALCGDAALRAWFGSDEPILTSDSLFLGVIIAGELVALGFIMMLRDLLLSLLAVVAPVYLVAAGAFGGLEALAGFGTLALRTIGAQSLVAASALMGSGLQDGHLTGNPLVWAVILLAMTLWALWRLWAKPAAVALARPADLGGALVLDGIQGFGERLSGVLTRAGALLGRAGGRMSAAPGLPGAIGRAAAVAGLSAAGAGRRAGDMAARAGRAAQRIRQNGAWKAALESASASMDANRPYSGVPAVEAPERVNMRVEWAALGTTGGREAAALAEHLRKAGVQVAGVDGGQVLLPRGEMEKARQAVRPRYAGRRAGEDGHRYVEFRASASTGVRDRLVDALKSAGVPDEAIKVEGSRVAVSYRHRRQAMAAVRKMRAAPFDEGSAVMSKGEFWAAVRAPAETMSQVAGLLEQQGIPTRVVGERIFIPPAAEQQAKTIIANALKNKTPYWTFGHRYIVMSDGVPMTLPNPPRDGFHMGPWRGG